MEGLVQLLEQLGIGGVVAAFVLVYERLRRLERRQDDLMKLLEYRLERIEKRLEKLDGELDEVRGELREMDKRVTWLYAKFNSEAQLG